ncbi:hypothetical protein [Amycolatopsis sp. NPDC049159]|uniref:hypothetical protein n=1 Tax=Amycolatopsis sp. NPDC049159 TaxID=3157210 RepID=UPI0033D4B470
MAERIGRVQQVILLCLLALCVTAMHHVSASDDEPHTVATSVSTSMSAGTGSGEHHAPGPDGAHDTLHLCLAVLTAIGALLLARLLFVRRPEAGNPVPRSYPRGSSIPERPPDRPGRTVLNVLCVLRV